MQTDPNGAADLADDALSVTDSSAESRRRSGGRICGCIPTSAESAVAFKQMMDLSLLKDSIFIMFAVSNFLTSIGFNVPYVYTVVRESPEK